MYLKNTSSSALEPTPCDIMGGELDNQDVPIIISHIHFHINGHMDVHACVYGCTLLLALHVYGCSFSCGCMPVLLWNLRVEYVPCRYWWLGDLERGIPVTFPGGTYQDSSSLNSTAGRQLFWPNPICRVKCHNAGMNPSRYTRIRSLRTYVHSTETNLSK